MSLHYSNAMLASIAFDLAMENYPVDEAVLAFLPIDGGIEFILELMADDTADTGTGVVSGPMTIRAGFKVQTTSRWSLIDVR